MVVTGASTSLKSVPCQCSVDTATVTVAGGRIRPSSIQATAGEIEIRFPYFITKHAPVSGVSSMLDYEITLRVELKPDWSDDNWDGLSEDLRKRLANAHEGLNFRIERAGAGDLPRFELKAKRTVDNRDAPIGAAT